MTKRVLCDYCGSFSEAKIVFSVQKSFGSYKVLELLQNVTQKTLPPNLGVKVCFMCCSNLMTTMGAIEKTLKMVENASLTKGAGTAKNKKAAAVQGEPSDETKQSAVVDLTAEGEMKSIQTQTTLLTKNIKMRPRSKSMAATSSDLIFPKTPAKKLDAINGSPSKNTPKKHTSRLEDSLDESVRLTPAKEVSANKKVFIQLFGSRNGDAGAPESDDEDEDDDKEEPTDKVITMKKDFDCKLCNFQTRIIKQFKEHLTKEHGQLRPRIYFCDACPKSFGILKSWKLHMGTVHGIKVEEPQKETKAKVTKAKEQKSKEEVTKPVEKPLNDTSNKPGEEEINKEPQEPKLAIIKALNGEAAAKKKWLKNAINNADYTFAVNGSSASTPKAGDNSIDLIEYKCDICDSVLGTSKQMQEHMKTAHQIEKPKIFKCPTCDKSLSSKQSLKHHMNLHSEGADAQKTSKRKILQDEKEVDSVDSLANKRTAEEDDEKPREEKILHTEEEQSSAVKEIASNTADDSLMAPPKTPSKKPKKVKDVSFQEAPQTITISDSPSKKAKRKKTEDASVNETNTVDLLDEINTNVKPHKKARLESSASDSICSSIDGYSTTDESVLSCNQCGKHVKSQQRLALHIQKRHGTKLECPGCQSSYQSQRDYVNHFAICSSGGSLLPCGVANCKKSFIEANYLSAHLRTKHQWA